jgi:hypothetical protein
MKCLSNRKFFETMKKLKYIGVALTLMVVGACEQELIETKNPEQANPCAGAAAGTASFTKFVSIGNSLTAGYQAGALFTAGQNESIAKILATQFACVGMTDAFDQPDINSVNGCYNPGGGCTLGRLVLFDPDGPTGPKSAGPAPSGTPGIPAPYNSGSAVTAFTGNKANLNNFAVPGILLGQALTADTGNPASPLFNGLWARFASQPGVKSIMEDAVAALADGGTFFMFWLGNNDVLGYAVSGGSNEAIFTSSAAFTAQYGAAIDALLAVPNVKGVVGNIPSVTAIPYFNLIPRKPIPLDAEKVGLLNPGFAGYNTALEALKGAPFNKPAAEVDARKVTWVVGANAPLIVDEFVESYGDEFDILLGAGAINQAQRDALVPYERVRQVTNDDRIPLPASAFLGTLVGNNPLLINGVTVPLADNWVLTKDEIALIAARTADFNAAIAAKVAASNNRIALADVNAAFNAFVAAGVTVVNGVPLTPGIAPPTAAFSEDAVHPNGRGAAFTANIFIDAINAKFGATIPKAKITDYKGTRLPLNPSL